MKTRTKVLALLMVCVMLLGVVAMIIPVSAGFDNTFDVRKAYDYVSSKDRQNKHEDIYYSYVRPRVATYAATAPVADGTVGEDEYTVVNESLTRSYTSKAFTLDNKIAFADAKEYKEYYAQDAENFYIAFELPKFAENITLTDATATTNIPLVFQLWYNNGGDYRINSNKNIMNMWSTGRMNFTTTFAEGVATTAVAAVGNGAIYDATKLLTDTQYTAAFKAPTATDTSAYIEYKINKAAFAAFFKTDKANEICFGLQFGSTDNNFNFLSNAMPDREMGTTLFDGSDEYWKQVGKNVDFTPVDVRYDLEMFGLKDYFVGGKIATAPAQDGAIAADEYTLALDFPKTNANNKSDFDFSEYFAWDDTYIYYAATIKGYAAQTDPIYLRLFPDALSPLAGQSWYNSIQWGISKGDAGWTVALNGGRNNERDHYDKVSNTNRFAEADDWAGSAAVVGEDLVFELKIDIMELTLCHCPGGEANTATEPYDNFKFLLNIKNTYNGTTLNEEAAKQLKAIDPNFKGGDVIAKSVTFSADAAPATTLAPATKPLYDFRESMPSIFVGAAATTAPAQDGAVGATEYTFSRFTPADKMLNGSSDTTEYFAYDADYVYIAVAIDDADAAKDKTFYLCFWTADDERAGASWFNRQQFCVTIADDGTATMAENGRRNNSNNHPIPSSGKNGSAVGTGKFDATANTAVYEFKFKRTELAAIFGGEAAVESFRYTWFTLDENMMVNVVKADSAEGALIKEADPTLSATNGNYRFGINVILKAAGTGDLAIEASTKPVETPPVTSETPATSDTPVVTTKAPATTVAPTDAPETDAPATTEAPKKKGCKNSITVSALALLPIIAGGVVIARKRED